MCMHWLSIRAPTAFIPANNEKEATGSVQYPKIYPNENEQPLLSIENSILKYVRGTRYILNFKISSEMFVYRL